MGAMGGAWACSKSELSRVGNGAPAYRNTADTGPIKMNSDTPAVVNLPTSGDQAARVAALREKFTTQYSHPPQFCVRAPGRVNLIGEHIDYCGYAVFPIAIEQDILMAVAPNDTGTLNLSNIDQCYPAFSCNINSFQIDRTKSSWHNYVLCGILGIKEEGGISGNLNGLDIVVSGNIPPSSGLSSSSALVCAAALATAYAHKCTLAKDTLAELCARSERHVGTQGGGMDQAISFLANTDTAKLIEFNPLRATSVPLPPGATFVVANSLAPINKAATSHFNCRVMECRLATKIMAKKAGLAWEKYQRLGELQGELGKTLPEMVEMVAQVLEKRLYSKQEVATLLDTTPEQLDKSVLTENTRDIQEFNLHDRALHVYSEANRVWEFHDICKEGGPGVLERLGSLMLSSHRSTQHQYQCSHPKLDTLVELSQGIALGARLTGAGWGGCMVALVEEAKVKQYKKKLEESFYSQEPEAKDINKVLFSTTPGSAACVYV